jgi:outer membrane receptor protein involved in Fe transport
VEVLKGPSSALYGGDAVGGAINIIRKKPQGSRSYDFLYKGGRFNSHQVAGGATGPIAGNRWLYRVDASHDYCNGWRGAGANRLNVSPSLTFLMSEGARVTIHQAFNRDNFKGDGGVPVSLTTTPGFDPTRRFSLPNDFALIEDSQTHVLFNSNISPAWEFRNGLLIRRTSEEYFVTEGVYHDPMTNTVPREGLYFHHTRRPYVNQAELVGRLNFLGRRLPEPSVTATVSGNGA